MPFPYKKVLVVGGTSGIGEGLAAHFVQHGISVVVVGRRKERLDEFVKKYGNDKASAVVFDISKLDQIPKFAEDVTTAHPDLDNVWLNSGLQRPFNFAEPEKVDMDKFDDEWCTNYSAFAHLTTAFLPHLQKRGEAGKESAIMYTTSGLALVPLVPVPGYCATKAALHHLIMAIRDQLLQSPEEKNKKIKIIELMPPAVQTELHDKKNHPDLENGNQIGIPLAEYVKETWKGLLAEKDEIPVGSAQLWYDDIEQKRRDIFFNTPLLRRKF